MHIPFRRGALPGLATVVVLAALGAEGEASPNRPAATPPAGSATCRTPSSLVLDPPKRAFDLPGGASVQIWQQQLQAKRTERLVAVHIPRGTLIPRAFAAPTLSEPTTPMSQAGFEPAAVVVINGAVFDPSGPAIPRRAQIIDGELRKGHKATDQGLALYEDSRTAAWALHHLVGEVNSIHGSLPLGAVNWQELSDAGVTAYTHAWGDSFHPTGSRAVVLRDGLVTEVISGQQRARLRPEPDEIFLTAPNGSSSAEALKRFLPGELVILRTAEEGELPLAAGRPSIGTPSGLIGVSSALVRRGANFASCNARDNKLRPRSALAWTASGDLIVAAVSGRGKDGEGSGGASTSQWAEYLMQLGAVNAVNLDGGGSTALLVRHSIGAPLERLDRDASSSRRVADSLGFVVSETIPVVTPTPRPPVLVPDPPGLP